MAAWWLIRRVNILSEAAVFIFKILGLSDSNMPGGIILLATSILCRISPLKSLKLLKREIRLFRTSSTAQIMRVFCRCFEIWGVLDLNSVDATS